MRERSRILKLEAARRDNFTCQKCKLQDETGKKLEAHHIIPLYLGGKDTLENIMTLCFDCHHYAPDKPEEFKEYMGEEMEGILTMSMNAWRRTRKEHPELFKEDVLLETKEETSINPKMDDGLEKLRKENEELRKEIEKLRSSRENQKKGMALKAQKGNHISRVAFGYKMINGNLVPAENYKEVEEIFEEFLNNKISLTKLAKKHSFSVNGLKKILTNFTYISKIKFGGQIFDGNHPPIISSTLFNHVQNKLESLGIGEIKNN